jgi:hypothetical protein
VLGRVTELAALYSSGEPFKHVVIEDFFTRDVAQRLLSEFPAFERGNNVGDDGKPGNKSTLERIQKLGPEFRLLDEQIRSREFLDLIGSLTGIPDLLYDPFYLGGGTHENRHGQTLNPHVDFNYHPSEGWHRRLNLIVYLNPEWDTTWGGNLELFKDPYADAVPLRRIAPLFNRCVIFGTTEHSWHGFDRIQLPPEKEAISRKSIALYFYSKTRPASEVAGKHTTHYVNAQLPSHLTSGYTLSETDVETLRALIQGRDDMLRRLYDENSNLRQAHDRGLSGKLIYLLRRLYIRYRR